MILGYKLRINRNRPANLCVRPAIFQCSGSTFLVAAANRLTSRRLLAATWRRQGDGLEERKATHSTGGQKFGI
jgi:hypothetical protein